MTQAEPTKQNLQGLCARLLALPCPEGAASLEGLAPAAAALQEEQGRALNLYEAALLAQAAKALQGSTPAFTALRDSAGDKPGARPVLEPEALTPADLALLKKLEALGRLEPPKVRRAAGKSGGKKAPGTAVGAGRGKAGPRP